MMNNHYVNFQQSKEMERIRKGSRVRIMHSALKSRTTKARIDDLEDEVLFLNLVNRTLISLLRERGLFSQDEFVNRLSQLDEADGKIDGGSTGDDLAREVGFEELPVDREKEAPAAPVSRKKRHRD